jgi:hypothetical protein
MLPVDKKSDDCDYAKRKLMRSEGPPHDATGRELWSPAPEVQERK